MDEILVMLLEMAERSQSCQVSVPFLIRELMRRGDMSDPKSLEIKAEQILAELEKRSNLTYDPIEDSFSLQ
jgi:hypothetical protein